jgi:cation diffusion facilitator CzcD-associated flavoprotein CzcO
MTAQTDVIVIGAGQSGPAATRALQARGISPVVLEAGPEPIGSWPRYAGTGLPWSPPITTRIATRSSATCAATRPVWTPTSAPVHQLARSSAVAETASSCVRPQGKPCAAGE